MLPEAQPASSVAVVILGDRFNNHFVLIPFPEDGRKLNATQHDLLFIFLKTEKKYWMRMLSTEISAMIYLRLNLILKIGSMIYSSPIKETKTEQLFCAFEFIKITFLKCKLS